MLQQRVREFFHYKRNRCVNCNAQARERRGEETVVKTLMCYTRGVLRRSSMLFDQEPELLGAMSAGLRRDVLLVINKDLVQRIQFLREATNTQSVVEPLDSAVGDQQGPRPGDPAPACRHLPAGRRPELYCTALHCTELYFTVLYCTGPRGRGKVRQMSAPLHTGPNPNGCVPNEGSTSEVANRHEASSGNFV
eukprot:2072006-Pyramimonas_sp.AAC.1